MTDPRPSVHLLAARRGALCLTLSVALQRIARVRLWGIVPPIRLVHPEDLVVVDLGDLPCGVDARSVEVLPSRGTILLLVLGDSPIWPAWIEVASRSSVRILHCSTSNGESRYDEVVAEVLRRVRGPSAERIATLVLDKEPALQPLELLVQAVCREPWLIRRPRDLARLCRTTLIDVRRRCAEAGFTRVEHFILCVRMVAYEQLVGTAGVPVARARLLVGIGDPSNLRRHARRAALRSPRGAAILNSLHAALVHGDRLHGKEAV